MFKCQLRPKRIFPQPAFRFFGYDHPWQWLAEKLCHFRHFCWHWLCDANFQKHELKVLPIYHFRMRANPISVSHRKTCTYHLPSIYFAILQRIEVSYSRLPFKSVCQGCQQKPLLKDGWEKLIRPRETRQTWMAAAYPTKKWAILSSTNGGIHELFKGG